MMHKVLNCKYINTTSLIQVEQNNDICEMLQGTHKVIISPGLNPCMGIFMLGSISYADNISDKFVYVTHNEGMSHDEIASIHKNPDKTEKIIYQFCKSIIENGIDTITSEISDEVVVEKITLDFAGMIRCVQLDSQNLQEKTAQTLKKILASNEQISQIASDFYDDIPIEVSIVTEFIEELERLDENNESSVMHLCIDLKPGKDPDISYYHGFSTAAEVFLTKKRGSSALFASDNSHQRAAPSRKGLDTSACFA